MNAWLLGIGGWCATSLATCLVVGAIIKRADTERPHELSDAEIAFQFHQQMRRENWKWEDAT